MLFRILFGLILILVSVITGIFVEKYKLPEKVPFSDFIVLQIQDKLGLPELPHLDKEKEEMVTNEKPIESSNEVLIMKDFHIYLKRPIEWTIFSASEKIEIYKGVQTFIEGEKDRITPLLVGNVTLIEEQTIDEYLGIQKSIADESEVLVNKNGNEVTVIRIGSTYSFIIPVRINEEVFVLRFDYISEENQTSPKIIEFIENIEIVSIEESLKRSE